MHLKPLYYPIKPPNSKWIVYLCALALCVLAPDIILHSLVWIVHTAYETTALMVEEVLDHVFGVEKYFAQLIGFYVSIASIIGLAVLLSIPLGNKLRTLKANLTMTLEHYVNKCLNRNTKRLLLQSAFMMSALLLFVT